MLFFVPSNSFFLEVSLHWGNLRVLNAIFTYSAEARGCGMSMAAPVIVGGGSVRFNLFFDIVSVYFIFSISYAAIGLINYRANH